MRLNFACSLIILLAAAECTSAFLSVQPALARLPGANSGFSLQKWPHASFRQQAGRRPGQLNMVFEDLFKGLSGGKEEYGKFERHGKLDGVGGAFGPLGVVCCGFGEDELEVLAETLENVMSGPEGIQSLHIPVVVLGRNDFKRKTKLREVLSEVQERDSVLPDESAEVSVPLVLLSGFSPIQVSAAVQAVRRSGIRGGEPGSQVAPLFAIAVPKSMDKDVGQLLEELESDAQLNDPAQPPPM